MESPDKGRNVTQDDVARHAGVSRSLVSYVLNGGPRPVAKDTRQRILDAIEELEYRPNKFARNLIKSRYSDVADKYYGIILADVFMLRRPYYATILAGIHNETHEDNRHIRFVRFFNELKDPLLFNELIHEEEISGLLLVALNQSIHSPEDERLLEQIRSRIENIVCVEWEMPGCDSVGFNRREATSQACRHLIQCGLKRIDYIGPDDDRVPAYRRELAVSGLGEGRVFTGSDIPGGYRICRELIDSGNLPQAFLGGTDEVSIGILRALNEAGFSIPEDLSLVSIDNIEVSAYTTPPLTTVNVDTWAMGRMAVQGLKRRKEHPDLAPSHTLVPTELVVRESCRPPVNH